MRPGLLLLLAALVSCGGATEDPNTGAGKAGQLGEPGESKDPPGNTTPPPPPAPSNAGCAVKTSIHEGFENGYPAAWGGANLGGLVLDSGAPISGNTSLKITPSPTVQRAYFASPQISGCAMTLKLTVRAEPSFFFGGAKTILARVTVGSAAIGIGIGETGHVLHVESPLDNDANALVSTNDAGTIAPNVPTTIAFAFDFLAHEGTFTVTPAGAPIGAPIPFSLNVAKDTNVSRVLVGLWSTNATGTVWLDDVAIDP